MAKDDNANSGGYFGVGWKNSKESKKKYECEKDSVLTPHTPGDDHLCYSTIDKVP